MNILARLAYLIGSSGGEPAGDGSLPALADQHVMRFMDRLERTPMDELRLFAVRPLDRATHAAARRRAIGAADRAGRADTRRGLADAISAFLVHSFERDASYPNALGGLAWQPLALRAEDRERLRLSLIDASLALITRDLIDEPTFEQLAGPCRRLVA